eukprot:CAMPEP_0174732958 /NCGR_PEP_ID=MMETSP1094-20130205/60370_1 /TAXON_ID=156173 /ORGANISM="Chrysochromulina brevifilum, Strain UTEX LB 985" /LENGTH=58 /DNA_ID=CAMNT_0015935541 /DNA_START=311 /DNA_END=487 /DNA_ORIENTATION=-
MISLAGNAPWPTALDACAVAPGPWPLAAWPLVLPPMASALWPTCDHGVPDVPAMGGLL